MKSSASHLLLSVFLLLLSGCINFEPVQDNARYHLLDHGATADTEKVALAAQAPNLYISQIDLPSYLENKKLAVRKSPTEIEFSETHRWIEPVGDSISRVLSSHILSRLQPDWTISHYPGRRSSSLGYEIHLKITRMEGSANKDAVLEGHLQIYQATPVPKLKNNAPFRFSRLWADEDPVKLPALFGEMTRELGEQILKGLQETITQP